MTIAKRVRDCRYIRGWGPDELASRASISRTALYQIECGKTETPRAGTLRRIAEALGVSIETLLGTESAPEPVVTNRVESVEPPWSGEREHRFQSYLPDSGHAPREGDLVRMFREVLDSPLGEGVARIVEDAHRMLPKFPKSSAR